MAYSLFIDQIPGETRAALVKDDQLQALHINHSGFGSDDRALEGNIYMGRIVNVVPALQAAFVDLGVGENGFLPLNTLSDKHNSTPVHEGRSLMVQVKKCAQADKGPALSAKIELQGKFLVLTKGTGSISLSKKIEDKIKRQELRQAMENHCPADGDVIVRTQAMDASLNDLKDDIRHLTDQWHQLHRLDLKAPYLLKGNRPFLQSLWDEYGHLSYERISVQGSSAYQDVSKLTDDCEPYAGSGLLFEHESLEDDIHSLTQSIVPLNGGGSIHIERTSALIAIDVNTGERLGGSNNQDNILETNLAALKAIKEQVKIRNLSGQIVIDFIRLKAQSHRDRLLDATKNAFKNDPRIIVHGFTRLGLMELSRSRKGFSSDEILVQPQTVLNSALRQLYYSSGRKEVKLGTSLYSRWQKYPPTWLRERLGYMPVPHLDSNLGANLFLIEEA